MIVLLTAAIEQHIPEDYVRHTTNSDVKDANLNQLNREIINHVNQVRLEMITAINGVATAVIGSLSPNLAQWLQCQMDFDLFA